MMKLYEFGPTRSLRPRWMLQHRHPDFLQVNPAGKVPVLVDGELILSESAATALYLAEKYPDRGPKLEPLWRII